MSEWVQFKIFNEPPNFWVERPGVLPGEWDAITYVVGVPGFVKIGRSEAFAKRLVDLQSGNPHRLELVAWIHGDREWDVHFDLKRNGVRPVRGEWFADDHRLRQTLNWLGYFKEWLAPSWTSPQALTEGIVRVNVDSKVLNDPRFKRLGQRLGIPWFEALGRCIPVWVAAYEARSPITTRADIDALAEHAGFAAAMEHVGDPTRPALATDVGDGVMRLSGVEERIEWLLIQDAKRVKANAARRSAAGVPTGPSPGKGASPGTVPGDTPPATPPGTAGRDVPITLALAPDLAHGDQISAPPPSGGDLVRGSDAEAPVEPGEGVWFRYAAIVLKATGREPTETPAAVGHLVQLRAQHGDDEVIRRAEFMFGGKHKLSGPFDTRTLYLNFDRFVPSSPPPTAQKPPSQTPAEVDPDERRAAHEIAKQFLAENG